MLEAHPAFPARTVAELIAHAKANPDKVSLASPPKGTAPFMAAELFKMMGGVEMLRVPYRGSAQMVPDLIGGQVQVAFDGISSSIEHIRTGSLRALAVATAARLEALPEVPTVAESVPGFEASGWCGAVAPRNTPSEITDWLHKEINAGLADSRIRSRLTDLGVTVLAGSTAQFGKLIADETEKWGKVVKFAGLKPD